MRRVVLAFLSVLWGISTCSLFGAFHDTIPVLESDLTQEQVARTTREIKDFYLKIPSASDLNILKFVHDGIYSQRHRVFTLLFNKLSAILFENTIDKNTLLKILYHLTKRDPHGERLQKYGAIDDQFMAIFDELQHDDQPNNPHFHKNDRRIVFLRGTFLDEGRRHANDFYANAMRDIKEKARRIEERFARLSEEEEEVAERMIRVCQSVIDKLTPLISIDDPLIFKQRFDDLKNNPVYQSFKHEYDMLRDAFVSGEYVTLAEVIDEG